MRKFIGTVGIVILALASNAQPTPALVTQQPDVLIAKGGGAPSGDDVFSDDGHGQTVTAKVKAGAPKLTFPLTGQNDGPLNDVFFVKGCSGNSKLQAKYKAGATNISADVKAGFYIAPSLLPGESFSGIALKVKAKPSAHSGMKLDCEVTMTSKVDLTKADTVAAIVTVK